MITADAANIAGAAANQAAETGYADEINAPIVKCFFVATREKMNEIKNRATWLCIAELTFYRTINGEAA